MFSQLRILESNISFKLLRWLLIWFLVLFIALGSNPVLAINDTIKIGVLSLRGNLKAEEAWQGMIEHLQNTVESHEFKIIPLGFDEINLAIRQRNVDFIIANSSIFVTLESRYNASAVATLYVRNSSGVPINSFGGVIISKADNPSITQIKDLKGRRVAAVSETSFGGWQTGLREIINKGVLPSEFKSLVFLETHDAVVEAVLSGEAEVGFVRTGTLEKMAREGSIRVRDLYVIGDRHLSYYPYRVSTQLYPEWPLAKLAHVPDDLALKIALSLFSMPESYMLYHSPYGAGWGLPQNYQPVHGLLRELKLPPYDHSESLTLPYTLKNYSQYLLLALISFLAGIGFIAYVLWINRRLKQHQTSLSQLNLELEARVNDRTSRIETLLLHEQYLRSIVQTVADVNQIIITSNNRMEMLKSACDRLVSHPDYRFAWVAALRSTEKGDCVERLISSYGSTEQLITLTQSTEILEKIKTALAQNQCLQITQADLNEARLDSLECSAAVFLPLRSDAFSTPIAMLCVYTHRSEGFDKDEISMLDQLAGDLGFAMHAFMRREESEQAETSRITNYEETIQALVDMIEKRDTYTAGHTRRVAQYSEMIARKMNLPESEIAALVKAATLHDIGKIIIPDAVLLKPAQLSELEYELIKQHVVVGYETLSGIKMYQDLAELMRHHHERLDGSGYPQGIKDGEIPLSSRIMAVADSFDAMTSNRIYKPRKTVTEALEELKDLAGKHYDEDVVDAAIEVFKNLNIDDQDHQEQLPASDIEKQRFAYFFNDQLTGLHNAEYLQFMLQRGLHVHFQSLQILLLKNFARYNERHGWHAGNELLKQFAHWLAIKCPNALLFRVMGDDFVVINAPEGWLNEFDLITHSPLSGTGIEVEYHPFECNDAGLTALQNYLN